MTHSCNSCDFFRRYFTLLSDCYNLEKGTLVQYSCAIFHHIKGFKETSYYWCIPVALNRREKAVKFHVGK